MGTIFACPPLMLARHAVLLTPSESSAPTPLLLYKQTAPVSPLFAALTNSAYLYHSKSFSNPLFSYSYELFALSKISTLLFSSDSELFAENMGGGGMRAPSPSANLSSFPGDSTRSKGAALHLPPARLDLAGVTSHR